MDINQRGAPLANAGAIGDRQDPCIIQGELSDSACQVFTNIIHQNKNREQLNEVHLFVICSLDLEVSFIYISIPNANKLVTLVYPIATPFRAVINRTKSLTNELNQFWINNQGFSENSSRNDDIKFFYESTATAYIKSSTLGYKSSNRKSLSIEYRNGNVDPEVKSTTTNPVQLGLEDSTSLGLVDIDDIPFQRLFDMQEEIRTDSNLGPELNHLDKAQPAESKVIPGGYPNSRFEKWHPIVSLIPSARDEIAGTKQIQESNITDEFHIQRLTTSSPTSHPKHQRRLLETISFILVPRYRLHYLLGNLSHDLRNWIPEVCKNLGWKLSNLSIRPDYIRWTLKDFPGYAIPGMLKIFRQETSKKIFSSYPTLKIGPDNIDFWSEGYIIDRKNHNFSTQSVNLLLTRQKIENQNQALNQSNSGFSGF